MMAMKILVIDSASYLPLIHTMLAGALLNLSRNWDKSNGKSCSFA